MDSIGDMAFTFYERWLKRTKETELKSGGRWATDLVKESDDPTMSASLRRELADQSPIFKKGVNKKTKDSIRAWFSIDADNKSAPIQADIKAIQAFEKRCSYKKKFTLAVTDAHVYGDGFILLIFDEPENVNLESAPFVGAEPKSCLVLSPEKVQEVRYTSEANQKKGIFHYVFQDSGKERLIHPDRIQHIMIEETSHSKLGLSKIDLLRNTIKTKKDVDIAVGRIMSWFSHGMLDIKAKDLTDSELKELNKVAKMHPTSWVHDEDDFEIDVINPTQLQPKDYLDFIVLNIASCLNMPVHVLTGIQVGKVTGAEIGFADYYKDILDLQELTYTPLIEKLYSRIIEARGRVWKYSLKWHTVYVDEIGEANIMEKRMLFVTQGFQAGVIDLEEGRRMLNEGLIELDVGKDIERPEPREPLMPKPESPFKAKEKKEKKEE